MRTVRFKDELQRQIYYRGQIDYCYWLLQEMSEHTGERQNPLEAMIDKATGFNKEKVLQNIRQTKNLIGLIIKYKKKLGYATDADAELLKKIKKVTVQGGMTARKDGHFWTQ